MGHNTVNTTVAVQQQLYSTFLVETLPEIMLPSGFTRNVSEFTNGDTINIPTIGAVTLQDASEGTPMTFNAIDSGRVTLSITDQVGDAWSVTDDLKEDSYALASIMSGRASASAIAIQEEYETSFLAACNAAQTVNDSNTINGGKHRFVANGSSRVATLDDFRYLKYVFDKAKVRQGGRIGIVDASVEAELNALYGCTWVSNNAQFTGIITEGFAQDHKFVANVFGFDLYTSNLLPVVGVEGALTDFAGNVTASVAGDVANIFMSVADEQSVPMMSAMRRMPSVEAWREAKERKDMYQVTTRYGFGAQRLDTLAIMISNPTFA